MRIREKNRKERVNNIKIKKLFNWFRRCQRVFYWFIKEVNG